MQKTRDNASRFKRELETNELLLVKNRNEVVNHQDYKQTVLGHTARANFNTRP